MIEHFKKTLPSILKQYHHAYGLTDVPIKIDLLRSMFEERGYADRIVWEEYDYAAKNIAAQVSFYTGEMGLYRGVGDYARIQFSKHLNFCWKRFAICKEMYHCILDKNPTNRTTSPADLMKLAELLVSGVGDLVEPFAPFSTEKLAEILALETLFPLELRQQHQAEYDAGRITDYQLALRYRIPEEFTGIGMYPNYMKMISDLRKDGLLDL